MIPKTLPSRIKPTQRLAGACRCLTSAAASSAARGQQETDDKFRARAERLDLWQPLEVVKRLGYRLAPLDPLRMRPGQSLAELSWASPLVDRLRANNEPVDPSGLLATSQTHMEASELLDRVWRIYAAGGASLEFAHLTNQQEVEWLTEQWERLHEELPSLDGPQSRRLAKLMLECETFDKYLESKFPTVKRYGCEGAESMLVFFDELLRLCQQIEAPVSELLIGMPHRGRLNLLACLLLPDPAAVLAKVRGDPELELREAWMAKGDVLSHLSANVRFVHATHQGQSPINVSLLPNPSHLELAAPMVVGAARGRAHNLRYGYSSSPKFEVPARLPLDGPPTGYSGQLKRVLAVQVHGDAALAGQGVIQETLQMANLEGFTVAGSLHLVLDNQIGFTTPSQLGRSSQHCTDVFKLIEAPVLHVNGADIGAVVRATRLTLAYRQRFAKDVAIRLVCFRKHGHNEMDEPSYTQPQMYSTIRQTKSIPEQFSDSIGLTDERRTEIADQFRQRLASAQRSLDALKPDNDNFRNFNLPSLFHRDHLLTWPTGCDLELLRSVALDSVQVPSDFKLHPNLERVLVRERMARFSSGQSPEQLARTRVDWATAEILAIGSLIRQNHSVRIVGQDVARGTFSTRHAVLFDQQTERPHIPLNHTTDGQNSRQLEIHNSILAEEAVLAYEFGHSIETCELTIWEAQFGDFFNTAQSALDTLVSSAEAKWLRQSALTLNLPHGLDGMGPEHSSGHLERFLQMSSSAESSVDTEASVNWSVCFPTLPSQYFHLLRRQVLRPFRKPLVIMSPKLIFRHPECLSDLAQLGPEAVFEPVLDDPDCPDVSRIDTLVFCSGKFYFQLRELKLKEALNNVALVRIEELCPFPIASIAQKLKKYSHVKPGNLIWAQEEHRNQGAYSFVASRLHHLASARVRYIGRPESELPATGTKLLHNRELEDVMRQFSSLRQAST